MKNENTIFYTLPVFIFGIIITMILMFLFEANAKADEIILSEKQRIELNKALEVEAPATVAKQYYPNEYHHFNEEIIYIPYDQVGKDEYQIKILKFSRKPDARDPNYNDITNDVHIYNIKEYVEGYFDVNENRWIYDGNVMEQYDDNGLATSVDGFIASSTLKPVEGERVFFSKREVLNLAFQRTRGEVMKQMRDLWVFLLPLGIGLLTSLILLSTVSKTLRIFS